MWLMATLPPMKKYYTSAHFTEYVREFSKVRLFLTCR